MGILNKFMSWYHGDNETEKAPPKSGIKRVVYILLNYTGKLILVNFIFLLCCIPVITIPAALTALNRYLIKILRVGYGFSLLDYVMEFKNNLFKGIPLGIVIGIICFYGYYLLSLANNFMPGVQQEMITGIGFGVLSLGLLSGSYIFVLAAMLNLAGKHLLKNAVILMIVEWKMSLLLEVTIWGMGFAVLAFAPYSILAVLPIGFSMLQLAVCAIINPVVNKRIIEPYERRNCGAIS
nr:DUF624 domain-containing protein [uncultured Clostridium sp.]